MTNILSSLQAAAAIAAAVIATNPPPTFTTKLAWDPNPDPSVMGYVLYQGTNSRSYTQRVPVGNGTSGSVSNCPYARTNYFAATSIDLAGLESEYSAEVTYYLAAPVKQAYTLLSVVAGTNQAGPWLPWTNGLPYTFTNATTGSLYFRFAITNWVQ